MTSSETNIKNDWRQHQDPVQSSVQFVIQWLAYLYPSCESSVDDAILKAQPFVDAELNTYWSQFLKSEPLEAHLNVLAWVAEQINQQQAPYLIQACWHLLLSKHQLPTVTPAAMRILEPVFSFEESELIRIGQRVRTELHSDIYTGVYQLESANPDYIYQLEQKLLLESKLIHKVVRGTYTDRSLILSFFTGALVGAAFLWTLQFYTTEIPVTEQASVSPPKSEVVATTKILVEKSEPEVEPLLPQIVKSEPANIEPVVQAEPETSKTDQESEPETSKIDQESEPEPEKPVDSKPEFKERLMEVTANVLNLRVGPDSSAEVISRLGKGAKVWQIGLSEDRRWALVRVSTFEGYVGAYFIKPSKTGSGEEAATSIQTQ